jgi:DNA repair protein RecO (recombination protein O)
VLFRQRIGYDQSMHEAKTEGIVLRSQDYKERHRIITLFSPQGLISLIVRGISRKNACLLTLTTPFTHGEYLYRQGRSDLLQFHDGTLLDDHLILRQNLKSLQAAGSLASAILTSQMTGKPAPALFLLYKSYHKQVSQFDDPAPLLASFYLKLLKHEGLLSISPHCAHCAHCEASLARFLYDGESLCSQHHVQGAFPFSSSEWETLLSLDTAQQFSTLRTLQLPPLLLQKIQTLFLSRITH